jgi:hypothetical protein
MDDVFRELFDATERTAVHLEMRDAYEPDDPVYRDWRAGVAFDPAERWSDWFKQVSAAVTRGVVVRRARIISEPVSEYVRYEHDITGALNIGSGEQVRWLPRRMASDLALPGNDFWVFDGKVAVFNIFDGNGSWVSEDSTRDPSVVKFLESAFAGVWARSIDHETYRLV